MPLSSNELKPRIGSELQIDRAALLSGDHSSEIRDLLVERGVIIVRDIALTDEEQRALASSLGDLRLGTVAKEGERGLMNPR